MESAFKFFFGLAIIMFCVLIIGIFLLLMKVLLLFYPEISFFGLVWTLDIPR